MVRVGLVLAHHVGPLIRLKSVATADTMTTHNIKLSETYLRCQHVHKGTQITPLHTPDQTVHVEKLRALADADGRTITGWLERTIDPEFEKETATRGPSAPRD